MNDKTIQNSMPLARLNYHHVAILAVIYAARLLGLFMLLPVFSPYAQHLTGATPQLVGLAFGIYGLTQACLQIPLGHLSDRIGRQTIIVLGLLCFAAGSLICALSTHIGLMIVGRAIQGAGAIGSTVIALTADLTPETHRTQAMALIGISIGASFMLSMILGPILASSLGVAGLFWIIFALAWISILLCLKALPKPAAHAAPLVRLPLSQSLRSVIQRPQLNLLTLSIGLLHALLSASFVVIPLCLLKHTNLPNSQHWQLYCIVIMLSLVLTLPGIVLIERKHIAKPILLMAIMLLTLAQAGLAWQHEHVLWIAGMLILFFGGFNILEASLPALISKIAPLPLKGTAMGVYSSSQFLGIFLGSLAAGWLMQHNNFNAVFYATAILGGLWLFIMLLAFQAPRPQRSLCYQLEQPLSANALEQVRQLTGVLEAYADERCYLHLKVATCQFQVSQLQALVPLQIAL